MDIFDLTDEEADLLHALGRRYFELLPDDERLVGIFRQHRAAHPGLYEPVEA